VRTLRVEKNHENIRSLLPDIRKLRQATFPYCKVESYLLADYLYDRSKAADAVRKCELAWMYYIHRQPADVQEAVGKIARLFRRVEEKPDVFGAK
jgi:hypothetical protein